MERLTVGDEIIFVYNDQAFKVMLAFIKLHDIVGIVKQNGPHKLPGNLQDGDLISFEIGNIFNVIPDASREKLYPYELMANDAHGNARVLHTRSPRLIASIINDEKVKAKPVVWIDVPDDDVVPTLLKEIANWYFFKFIKK